MKTRTLCALATVFALSLSAVALASPARSSKNATANETVSPVSIQKGQYPVTGQIDTSYELSPNAEIEVNGIEGSVKIETTNANRAEVHFVRHARTQRDYDCETIVVDHSSRGLTIDHRTDGACRVIQSYEELTLVVPASASLIVGRIEGDLTVGGTAGYLQLNNIEGSVLAGEVQAAQIASVEGNVSLESNGLGAQGISVRGVEGNVELRLAEHLNANLRVRRAENVDIDLPNAPNKQVRTNSYQDEDELRRAGIDMQLGSGGPTVLISGIEGSVRVRRL